MEEHKLFVGSLPPDITKEEIEMVFKTYGEVADVHVISGDRNRSNSGQACAFVMYKAREYGDAAIQVLNNIYKIREDAPNPIQVNWARSSKGGGKDGGKGGWGNGKGDYGGCGGYGGGYGGCGGCGGGYGGGCGGGYGGSCGGGYGCGGGCGGCGGGCGYGGGCGGCGGCGGFGGGGKGASGDWDWSKGGSGPAGTKLFVGNLPTDITEEALNYVFRSYGTVLKTFIMSGKSKSGQNCAFVEYEKPDQAETAILTLHEKYEIKPGAGTILVKRAKSTRVGPY